VALRKAEYGDAGPELLEALLHLAEILRVLDRVQEARQTWQHAARLAASETSVPAPLRTQLDALATALRRP
jgi:hypothetical protein